MSDSLVPVIDADPIATREASTRLKYKQLRDFYVFCLRLYFTHHEHGESLVLAMGSRMPWRSHGATNNVSDAGDVLRAAELFGIVKLICINPTTNQRVFGVGGLWLTQSPGGKWNSDDRTLGFFEPGPRLVEFVKTRAFGWLTEDEERVCREVLNASWEGTWPRHMGERGGAVGLGAPTG